MAEAVRYPIRDGELQITARKGGKVPQLTKSLRRLIEERGKPLARELTRVVNSIKQAQAEEKVGKDDVRTRLVPALLAAGIEGIAWPEEGIGLQFTLKTKAVYKRPFDLLSYLVRNHKTSYLKEIKLKGEMLTNEAFLTALMAALEELPAKEREKLGLSLREEFDLDRRRRRIRPPQGCYQRSKATTEVAVGIKVDEPDETDEPEEPEAIPEAA